MSKKILVLAETIDVNASSAGKANMGFVNALVHNDHEVAVLHFSHKIVHIKGASTTLIKELKTDPFYWLSRLQRVLQRLTGKNFSVPLENKFGFSFTFKNDANSMVAAVKKMRGDFNLVITLSKAASFRTHAALLLLPDLHAKWLAYVHDPYPFHLYPPPYHWIEAGYEQKEAFFRAVSEKAAFSGFPSLLLKEWMGQYFPNFLKTGIILPHQNINTKLKAVAIPDYLEVQKFSIMHAGSLLDHRNPFPLIEGFQKFIEKTKGAAKNSQLLLIGASQAHEPKLTKICKRLPQVYKSDGYINYNEVQVLQKKVSVLLILEAISEISPFLPGKFPHYISEDKPIVHLGPKKSETRRLLGETYRYSCEAGDVIAISEIFMELYAAWKVNNNLSLERPDLLKYISPEYFNKQMSKIFDCE
ncbi:UDP-glycosyltransferase [Patiriisocius sp. Uisw_017]|uniref:UDP-glycosyltransferase n=1 Tax=Patiriisocius sp. Uisw_017 TaxID=3230968 RepID=UPI0039ECE0F0